MLMIIFAFAVFFVLAVFIAVALPLILRKQRRARHARRHRGYIDIRERTKID